MKLTKTLFFITAAALFTLSSCLSSKSVENTKDNCPELKNVMAIHNPEPEGEIELLDNFEDGNYWQAEGFQKENDFSIETEISSLWYTEGSFSGQWTFGERTENGTSSFYCEALLDKNWTDAPYLIVDINNATSSPVLIQVAVESGKENAETFTQEVAIGVGENTNVYFDLLHSLTDKDGNSVPGIYESSQIKKLSFIVKGNSSSGEIFADNIRLARSTSL